MAPVTVTVKVSVTSAAREELAVTVTVVTPVPTAVTRTLNVANENPRTPLTRLIISAVATDGLALVAVRANPENELAVAALATAGNGGLTYCLPPLTEIVTSSNEVICPEPFESMTVMLNLFSAQAPLGSVALSVISAVPTVTPRTSRLANPSGTTFNTFLMLATAGLALVAE